jgi:formate hydrogenlyase subunit 3/multisubunit Na+/H+ antiporter MnhD subunit
MISSFFPQLATFAFGPQTIAIALATPLVFLLGCVAPRLSTLRPALLALAPLPALAASILAADSGPLVLDQTLFPAIFVLDPPGALLLGASALLWIAAGAYAIAAMRAQLENAWFASCWLLTLLGNVGVFLAADLASFYLSFALVSLPAYALFLGRQGVRDEVGRLYFSVALLGEALLIVAFAGLALGAPDRSLVIADGVATLAASPWRDVTIGLLIAGFGTKIGLLPFHVWMPSTYRTAPTPVAALLSGAAVNAGVIGLLRFLPWDVGIPAWGNALVILGMFGAFYGVAIGLTQRDAKVVLAYSSVSQMGLVAATVGKGLIVGNGAAADAAALYAAHHCLAKGGLFLGIGVVASAALGRRTWMIPLVALLALSLAGLPPTGGAIAKLALKGPLGEGLVGALSILSAIATTLLMLLFVAMLRRIPPSHEEGPTPGFIGPWLVVTIASVAVPTVYLLETMPAVVAQLLDFRLLWKILWPVMAGAILAAISWRWINRLPHAPEGDIAVLLQRAARKLSSVGAYVSGSEQALQEWPVAAAMLIAIVVTLAGAGFLER